MKLDFDRILEDSGAVLKGHFLLTSGRHSDIYVEKFRLLERPDVLTALCKRLVEQLETLRLTFDVVAGPTTGGIIVAYEVARQLGVPALYIESEDGRRKLRRGAKVPSGAKVLVVDDVLTTGKSVRESIEAIKAAGGKPSAAGVLIDRSEMPLDFGCPLFAVHRVEAKSYAPDEVPAWLAQTPITKPGTGV